MGIVQSNGRVVADTPVAHIDVAYTADENVADGDKIHYHAPFWLNLAALITAFAVLVYPVLGALTLIELLPGVNYLDPFVLFLLWVILGGVAFVVVLLHAIQYYGSMRSTAPSHMNAITGHLITITMAYTVGLVSLSCFISEYGRHISVLAPAVPLAPVIYTDWNVVCVLVSLSGMAAFVANLVFYHGLARPYNRSLALNRVRADAAVGAAIGGAGAGVSMRAGF